MPAARPILTATRCRQWLLDTVYPRVCAGCEQPMSGDPGHLCWDCRSALEWIQAPFCRICGDPVYGCIGHEYRCAACQAVPPRFDAARSAARYRGTLQEAIRSFKYRNRLEIGADAGEMLEACVRAHFAHVSFDGVLGVPLHPRKRRARTYNQAAVLAGELARRLRLPQSGRLLERIKPTVSQTGLSAAQRRANMEGAFRARQTDWIEGRVFLLTDDVMTTGATVNACARQLKHAGARAVYVVTVARG
jgi:ComF family protein